MNKYINLDEKNIDEANICCVIGVPKHQDVVEQCMNGLKIYLMKNDMG